MPTLGKNAQTAAELRTLFAEMCRYFPALENILVQSMFTLGTGENSHWKGGPGRAKTMIATLIMNAFPDANKFWKPLTKDMLSSDLLGEEIAKLTYETGSVQRNLIGGLAWCNFFFGDEFMDAPDWLLRTILTIFEEHMYVSKDQQLPVPLHSAFTATNTERRNQATEAVYDRMVCQAVFPAIHGLVQTKAMFNGYLSHEGNKPPLPQLHYQDLYDLTHTIQSPNGIMFPKQFELLQAFLIDRYVEKRTACEKARLAKEQDKPESEVSDSDVALVEVTPRRKNKTLDFVRAAAILNGRDEVVPNDLRASRYALVVLNDGSCDDEIWEEVCRDYIINDKDRLDRLRNLAEVSEKIFAMKQGRQGFVATHIGHRLIETSMDLANFIDNVSGRNCPTLTMISAELKQDLQSINAPANITDFPLQGDWAVA